MYLNKKEISSIVLGIIAVVILILVLSFSSRIYENVSADEIVIIQDPIDGELHYYTTPGMKYQNFGNATHYKKRFQYSFSAKKDQGKKIDQSIKIRFQDGGHAFISGTVDCEMPLDDANLEKLHMKYNTQKAVENELIRPVFEKCIYMTGPLMTSEESYARRRTELISFIEDQSIRGVYKTSSYEDKIKDTLTGIEKTVRKVKIVTVEGKKQREEISPLSLFAIKTYNLSITRIAYDATVEKQIEEQQNAYMQVQTAIAEAKQAEQKTLTVKEEGKAQAEKAKWEEEEKKIRAITKAEEKVAVAKLRKDEAVTQAQERLAVAELDKRAAEQTKQENILLGQGESERKKLVMAADGALKQKLAAYVNVMKIFADRFGQQKWVPDTQIINGGDSKNGGGVVDFINLLTAKTLSDLNLDMTMKGK